MQVNLGKSLTTTYDYIFSTKDNATFTSKCIFKNITSLEEQLEKSKKKLEGIWRIFIVSYSCDWKYSFIIDFNLVTRMSPTIVLRI